MSFGHGLIKVKFIDTHFMEFWEVESNNVTWTWTQNLATKENNPTPHSNKALVSYFLYQTYFYTFQTFIIYFLSDLFHEIISDIID